jgi:hypothetical protein
MYHERTSVNYIYVVFEMSYSTVYCRNICIDVIHFFSVIQILSFAPRGIKNKERGNA